MSPAPLMPPFAPETLGELADHLAAMATYAPKYERFYNPNGDPAAEFEATRGGLANVRSKLGERAYEYLLARVEENWRRLQSGDKQDLLQLKLSFSEMIHFLRTRKYKAKNLTEEWAEHTDIR